MRFLGEPEFFLNEIGLGGGGATADGRMASHPESFPVNTLVPIEGTPLEGNDVSDPTITAV